MGNTGLIGHSGFLGSIVKSMVKFDNYYNTNNVISIPKTEFELVICAAPTGNRLAVQTNARDDLEMILFLIDHLRKTKIKKFILLSTIDTIARPNTRYGMNRKILEGWVKNNLDNSTIIRMPTLIHPAIRKNILFDLKHDQYLEKLNPHSAVQYYDLTNLKTDIDYAVTSTEKEINLFSEPIVNQEIVDRFFPGKILGNSAGPVQQYNAMPQRYKKEDIFDSMDNYFNEVPLHLW